MYINPLNADLNPTCHLLTLLAAHHILHVSRVRVKNENIKIIILIKEVDSLKYSMCIVDAHIPASAASQSAESLQNETRRKR
jgi:hypothetical protein